MKIFALGLLFVSSIAVAQADDVSRALTTKVDGASFEASLKDGFHFNEAAPNLVTVDGKGYKPATAKPREMTFTYANTMFTTGHASLYICDDALTFCQPHSVEFGKVGAQRADDAKEKIRNKTKITKNEFGFIEDNLEAAAAQALKEKKLVLIDFSARWCPGCIRLENEVFGTKAFKNATKKFVTVRMDYDRFDNLKIAKETYNLRVIPSLIVTNAKLEEISRSLDFQPMPTLAAFLADARKNALPFAELQKKADAGDKEAALTVGRRLYASSQYAKSAEYLARAKTPPVELADARVQAAKDAAKANDKLKPELEKTLRDAIKHEPSSSRSIVWRTDLVEAISDSNEKKKIGQEGLAVGDSILAHPESLKDAMAGDPVGEFTDYERMYVASERADLAESAGLDESVQQTARLKVTELAKEAKIPVDRKGPALRYLIFLIAAKQIPEADVQVNAMLKQDSKNPELQRRHLRVLNGLKTYSEAVQVGRDLLPLSFGKNEVWVAQQLAKAYLGAGKKLEAQALAKAYLGRTDIDWSMMKNEQKDLQDLAASQ